MLTGTSPSENSITSNSLSCSSVETSSAVLVFFFLSEGIVSVALSCVVCNAESSAVLAILAPITDACTPGPPVKPCIPAAPITCSSTSAKDLFKSSPSCSNVLVVLSDKPSAVLLAIAVPVALAVLRKNP